MLVRCFCLAMLVVAGVRGQMIPGAPVDPSLTPGATNPATPVPDPNGVPVVPTASNGVVLNQNGMPAGSKGPIGQGLPPGLSPASNIVPGALVILQPNSQTYAVEKRQLVVTWQPMDPTITLQSLPPNLVIEAYPEIPIPVGGPFGFTSLVRTDAGQFKYDIPKGWAGEHWVIVLREQGGAQVIAGQRFAVKPEGTPLAPTTNLAGNTMFTPASPGGWPMRSAAERVEGLAMAMVAVTATAVAMLMA